MLYFVKDKINVATMPSVIYGSHFKYDGFR